VDYERLSRVYVVADDETSEKGKDDTRAFLKWHFRSRWDLQKLRI
jgi:hypothetical protein